MAIFLSMRDKASESQKAAQLLEVEGLYAVSLSRYYYRLLQTLVAILDERSEPWERWAAGVTFHNSVCGKIMALLPGKEQVFKSKFESVKAQRNRADYTRRKISPQDVLGVRRIIADIETILKDIR